MNAQQERILKLMTLAQVGRGVTLPVSAAEMAQILDWANRYHDIANANPLIAAYYDGLPGAVRR